MYFASSLTPSGKYSSFACLSPHKSHLGGATCWPWAYWSCNCPMVIASTCLVKASICLFMAVWFARMTLLSLTPKRPFSFSRVYHGTHFGPCSLLWFKLHGQSYLMIPPAEASKNILWLCVNPSVKSCRYDFSLKSCGGHLLSKSLSRSPASYNESFSLCLNLVISCFSPNIWT